MGTNCNDLDPVKDCGYKFNAWTQCARNPYVTDGSCHQTRTIESSNAQITGIPCYGANQKLTGELGEKVCPCPAGTGVTGNAEPRECRGNGRFCLAGTSYTTWMKANCKQTCATYLANPPVVDTWIGNCATYKDKATPNGKTYCTDEDFSSWQKLCMKTCQ